MCATKSKTNRSPDRMEDLWFQCQGALREFERLARIADDDPDAPKGSPAWRTHQAYCRYADIRARLISMPAQDILGIATKLSVLCEIEEPHKDPHMLTNQIILAVFKDALRLSQHLSPRLDAKLIALCEEQQKAEAEWNTYGKRKAPSEKKLFEMQKKGVGEREARRKSGLADIERQEKKVIARCDRLAVRVAKIPAHTLEGLALKVKVALDEAAIVSPETDFSVLTSVAADVKRLAGRARS